MYTSFYNLNTKPFQIASDPTFIWLGEKHKEALATLTYGVLDNKGFMLLTGDVGTGKTTLINTLIRGLSDDILYASVPDPRLSLNDFLNYIAHSFGIRKNFKTKGKFLIYFSDFLVQCNQNNKKVLLLIDEAQLLTQDLLEEIRLLSNIQKDGLNLLNIFFIGQDEFNEILERQENRALAQRLTLNYHLKPLTDQETEKYITHRLSVAGLTKQVFDAEAFMEIHRYSGGFPRRINILCDHCLLTGFVREQRVIGGDVVRYCAQELKIPQYTGRSNTPERPQPSQSVANSPAVQPDWNPAPVKPQSGPSVHIPVEPDPTKEEAVDQVVNRVAPPVRPIPPKPPRSFPRPLIYGVLALVAGIVALFYFDRATFDKLYSGAELQLMTLQERLGLVDSPSQPVVVQPKPAVETPEATVAPTKVEPSAETPAQQQPDEERAGKEMQPAPTNDADQTTADSGTEPASATGVTEPSSLIPEPSVSDVADHENGDRPVEELPATQSAAEPLTTEPAARMQLAAPEEKTQDVLPQAPAELPEKTIMVRFDNDSSEFFFQDLHDINALVAALKQHPDAILLISGHTDSYGSDGYNYRLSLFRANMVKSFFLGKGLPSHQLRVQAFGSQQPLDTNDTAEGRSLNRRVELDVLQ